MYIEVHKVGNQWLRNDNGALVGTEIARSSSYYKKIAKIIGNQIIIKNDKGETKTIYYGRFVNNKFVRFDIPDSEKVFYKTCKHYAFVPG